MPDNAGGSTSDQSSGHPLAMESDARELTARSALARDAARAATARYAEILTTSNEQHVVLSHAQREAARQEIRVAIGRYVTVLKALGTPPEGTLRLVKEVVRENLRDDVAFDAIPLMEQVGQWCIAFYYTPAA